MKQAILCHWISIGMESHTDMFHGGMIFRDASSKYIHMQNQVLMGAGETVNAKMQFED